MSKKKETNSKPLEEVKENMEIERDKDVKRDIPDLDKDVPVAPETDDRKVEKSPSELKKLREKKFKKAKKDVDCHVKYLEETVLARFEDIQKEYASEENARTIDCICQAINWQRKLANKRKELWGIKK